MYDIEVDRTDGVIDVKLSGMMTVDEVAAYIADLKRAFVTNGLREYGMVIDVRDCVIQPQDVIQAMGTHMVTMPKAKAIAIVTGSSLARMQVRRLFTQSYARIVDDVAQGRAWVRSGTEPARASAAPIQTAVGDDV